MKRSLIGLFIAALAPLIAGCSNVAPPIGEHAQSIINGTTDTTDTAVVLVLSQVPGSNMASLCTGEIISPHVILTAAHCVDPDVVGVGAKTYVFIGTTLPMAAPPANQLLTVSETHFDTAFSATAPQNGHDVGIVILKDPTTITPVPYNRTALPQSLVNQPARLVGYGITSGTDTQGTSAGTRRQAPTILASFDSTLLNFQDMQHNICEGDSGGPAFMTINGKEVIVGVTSFGIDKCPLTQPGTDTRVDAYAAFIDGFVLMFDPPTHGAGDTCSADSDCYPRSCEQTSAGQICAQSCDPAAKPDACPTGTQCTSVDGQNLCVKPGSGGSGGGDKGGGGCDVGGGLPGGAGLGLMLLALVVLWTARRARS